MVQFPRSRKLAGDATAWLNLFLSKASGLRFRIGSLGFGLEPLLEPGAPDRDCRVLLGCGEGTITLEAGVGALAVLAADRFPDAPLEEMAPALRLALLESVIDAPLSDLEPVIGLPLTIRNLSVGDGPPFREPAVAVTVLARGEPRGGTASAPASFLVRIGLDRPAMTRLAGPLARLPVPATGAWEALPFYLPVRIGQVRIPVRELREIDTGDLLLLDGCRLHDRNRVAIPVVPGRTLFARLEPGVAIVESLSNGMDGSADVAAIDDRSNSEPPHSTGSTPISGVDALEIDLTFDLGCLRLTLAEIRALAPGQAFPMPSDPRYPVTVRANGQKVGRGELVEIDDRLGVRLLELFGSGHD